MTRLDLICSTPHCKKHGVMGVVRTNDELPDSYIQIGVRRVVYCADHLPEDVRTAWEINARALTCDL